jgi:hypothetical protein
LNQLACKTSLSLLLFSSSYLSYKNVMKKHIKLIILPIILYVSMLINQYWKVVVRQFKEKQKLVATRTL